MEKNILLFFIGFTTFFLPSIAKTQNTIVNDNSSWNTLVTSSTFPPVVFTEYVYFDGDSILNGHTYKKVFLCNDSLHENIVYAGLMREYDKKTYYIEPNFEIEYLQYDFSLEEGMAFEYTEPIYNPEPFIVTYYVKEVDFVEINGVQKKQIKFTSQPNSSSIRATWIENIGSFNGIFHPFGTLRPGSSRMLSCYFQDEELIFKNSEYEECFYSNVSVQTIEAENYYIYPNPVDDIFAISSPNNTIISRVEIFDHLGRMVYNQDDKDNMNVSSLAKGLYIVKVYDANKKVLMFKIVKK